MFNIQVDLNALLDIKEDLDPDWGLLQQGVVNAAQYVRDVWVSAVQGTILPGMAMAVQDDSYAKSLATGESMRFPEFLHAVVLPNNYEEGVQRIEDGYEAFDMKPGLLNGPKSRPLKDGQGRYNTVPFRHYTPKSTSAISVVMRMPNEVYNSAKTLSKSQPNANGVMQWGQSLDWDEHPATSWNGYVHQSNIYQGMYRVGMDKHTQYLTFRRVSTPRTKTITRGPRKGQAIQLGSDPQSWWHPGLSPNPVIQSVYDYCMPEVEKNLVEVAKRAFGIK